MVLSNTFRAGLGIVTMLLAAVPSAGADNVAGGALAAGALGSAAGEGALRHLRALQDIATANGGNRAAGTPGYDRSADYVARRLEEAGYSVRLEEFEFPFFEDRTPPVLVTIDQDGAQEPAGAVRTLSNSGSSDVTGRLRAVKLGLGEGPPVASTSGCEAADFDGFERGAVALIRRGTCPFQTKVENAVAAGALGVVIMNEGTDGRTDVFSGLLSKPAAPPVVGVSYDRGRSLDMTARTDGGVTVRVAVDAVTGRRATRNVLAEMGSNGDGSLIIVGAHLDSVAEGPGINDNGSGSAAVLEAALRLAREPAQKAAKEATHGAAQEPARIRGRVRFAFWSAEERGLVGSRRHVEALSEEERRNIALYVNLDMVGSPNFVRYIQASAATPDGPAAIARRELAADFREHGLPFEERTGGRTRTDDASFFQKDIPTVGLYAGAGGPKSEAQAGLFGGAAGRPYDPCYHRACDTIENINPEVLEENTRALVRALDAVTAAPEGMSAPAQKAVDLPEPKL
jgi:Zn-dependent M28 family amino/carboxypeptidase